MKMLLILFSAVILSGCATGAKYEKQVSAWVGQSEDSLVRGWGAPNSTFKMGNGKTVYTYNYSGGTAVFNNGGYMNAVPVECRTEFFVNESGFVDGYNFLGNACRAQ